MFFRALKDNCKSEELNLFQLEYKIPNIVHFERWEYNYVVGVNLNARFSCSSPLSGPSV